MDSTESPTANCPTPSPTPSGPSASETLNDRLTEVDRILDSYEQPFGLGVAGEDEVTTECRHLLSLSPSVVRRFSPVDCGEAAYVLRQLAFRLQQAVNREQTRISWAEACRKASPSLAKPLEKIKVHAGLRMSRVAFLAGKAGDLAKAMEALQFTKRGQTNE